MVPCLGVCWTYVPEKSPESNRLDLEKRGKIGGRVVVLLDRLPYSALQRGVWPAAAEENPCIEKLNRKTSFR